MMRDDQLQELLRAADAGASARPPAAGDLAQRVRALAEQRRRRNRLAVVAIPTLLVLFTAGWLAIDRPTSTPPIATIGVDTQPAEGIEPASLEDEISRLSAEAEHHRRVAMQIVALRQRDEAQEQASGAINAETAQETIDEQLEVVAYRLILRADALRQTLADKPQAAAIYQDIVRLYPTTQSADLARQRLNDMGIAQGDT